MVGLGKQLLDELSIEDIKHSNKQMAEYKPMIESMFFAKGQIFIFKR